MKKGTMLRNHRILTISIAIVALGLQGCMDSYIKPAAQTSGPCVGGAAGNIAGFKVSVSGFRWAKQVMQPGFENIPKAQLEHDFALQAYLKPQASFLEVKLKIVNTSNSPLAWNNPLMGYAFAYQLTNAQGTKYTYSTQASNILQKTGMNNINPGVPLEGSVVFDVPKGDYKFSIIQERYSGFGCRRTQAFMCSLGS